MTDYEKLEEAAKLIAEVVIARPDSGRLFGGTRATPHMMRAHGYVREAIYEVGNEIKIQEFVSKKERESNENSSI